MDGTRVLRHRQHFLNDYCHRKSPFSLCSQFCFVSRNRNDGGRLRKSPRQPMITYPDTPMHPYCSFSCMHVFFCQAINLDLHIRDHSPLSLRFPPFFPTMNPIFSRWFYSWFFCRDVQHNLVIIFYGFC